MAAKKRKKAKKSTTQKTAKRASTRKAPKSRKSRSSSNPIVGHITRRPGKMYYADKAGNVREASMNKRGRPKGSKTRCRTPK
jgi:hypothetical protein